MKLPERVLVQLLTQPSPEDVWALQPVLLALGTPTAEAARDLARMYYCYLSSVRSKLSSRQYSELAARLAVSSIGVIAVHEMIQVLSTDRRHTFDTLLTGGLSSALETISTLQHVKAWNIEVESLHDEALWNLYGALWALSAEMQPGLAADQRQALIERLMAVARHPDLNPAGRVAVIIRLFQTLLAIRLVLLFDVTAADEEGLPEEAT